MKLTMKYEQKDFWGINEYKEDINEFPEFADLKKAFQYLRKHPEAALQIDNTCLYWETMQNHEHGTLTAREWTNSGWKEVLWDFEGCKMHYYKEFKERH